MAVAPTTLIPEGRAPIGWRILIWSAHVLAALLIGLLWSLLLSILYVVIVGIAMGWKNRARILGQGKRQRLKFTPEGKYAVGIAIGVGIAAINTGNNLLYLFLGMILSLIVISGILSELTLRGLEVERSLPQRIFAGQAFLTAIRIRNTKRRLPSFSVQIEDLSDGLNRTKKCFFLKVRASRLQETSYRAEFPRRGNYQFREIHLVTRFPFSFFVKRRILSNHSTAVVFPRIHSVDDFLAISDSSGDAYAVPIKGLGREFHGLRDYQLGDDARDIHWGRSAGREDIVVREYAIEGAPTTAIGLNTKVSCAIDHENDEQVASFDRCVDYAASLVVHFIGRGYDVEFVTPDGRWLVSAQGQGLDALLRSLAVLDFQHVPAADVVLWPGHPEILVTHNLGESSLPHHPVAHVINP